MSDGITVGLIGIGNMGWPMSKNLAKAGHALTVFDADPAKVARFVADTPGVKPANGVAGLAQASQVIVTMLPTGVIVREVMHGALAERAFAPGAIVVDMSSSEPAGTKELGAALKAAGVTLIDSPVSGGVPGAESGKLTLMIGSDDEAAVARVTPVLQSMGAKLFRTGALGSGHAMKALNNYLSGANFRAATEALAIGMQFGLDPALMLEIINASTGRSVATEGALKTQALSGKFAAGFSLGLLTKDIKIASDLASELGVLAPGVALTQNVYADARAALGYGADFTAAYKHWTRDIGRKA